MFFPTLKAIQYGIESGLHYQDLKLDQMYGISLQNKMRALHITLFLQNAHLLTCFHLWDHIGETDHDHYH